ncbi:hypothetical protein NHX12_024023 [Muraenolepis orangiensis]|uniref:Uncharacterized protein n=1 Tax=Muraenolepis orangiensis TaxID=630683 RepID=A0A9Q0EKV4_9TELE|nr:hypothetical protein NHX12_024023 [Muraenolepis orangiensis]
MMPKKERLQKRKEKERQETAKSSTSLNVWLKPSTSSNTQATMERQEEALEATPDTEPKDDQEITVSVEEEEATGGETVDNVEFEEVIEESDVEETNCDFDLSTAYTVVDGVIDTLSNLRTEEQFGKLFKSATEKVEAGGISIPTVPPGQQRQRKVPAKYRQSTNAAIPSSQ